MTPNSVCNVVDPNLNDAMASPRHNTRTVECRLKTTYSKLARTEANIFLFSRLKSLNLATNDVTSFVEKQMTHKRTSKVPDNKVKRAAMNSKLVDAVAYTKRLRQERDLLKRRLSRKYSSRKAQGRKTCADLVALYHREKDSEILAAKQKIDHLRYRELKEREIKSAPESTREYLSNVNVFSKGQNKLKPLDPETPFICSKDICLNENELKLLARGPNFLICDELDAETFDIEVEKAIVKEKYNSMFNSKDDCSDESLDLCVT